MESVEPKTKTTRGEESVARVANSLSVRGNRVKTHLPYNSPFDLLCNGKRVEVKTANLRDCGGSQGWKFNIHRHGKLNEGDVDVYIFELRADFLTNPVLLFYLSPLSVKSVCITLYSLIRGSLADHIDRYDLLEPVVPNPTLPELIEQGASYAAGAQ